MKTVKARPRRKESGFALLLVFLMAAVIAITLYAEIPRVAFDAQRQKEQLLIERGEQYKRALQVFFTTNKRYPAKIEDLENFNNRRFLRKRYIDPLTGKDEWRIIHVANGVLTDSATMKQKGGDQKQAASTEGQYVGVQAGIVQAPGQGQQPGVINARDRRRANEGGGGLPVLGPDGQPMQPQPGAAGEVPPQGIPGQVGPAASGMPGGQFPGSQVPGVQIPQGVTGIAGVPQIPGMPQPGGPAQQFPVVRGSTQLPGQPQQLPGQQQPGGGSTGGSYLGSGSSYLGSGGTYLGSGPVTGAQPGAPGIPPALPGQPGQQFPGVPGPPVSSQTGGVSPSPVPGAFGSVPPGFQQPGFNTTTPNAAAGLINQILTSPRPGGLQGIQGAQQGVLGAAMGSGIAGFASTAEGESIMTYNDHTNYGEWEFIFDPTKVRQPPNPNQGSVGTPAEKLGSSPGNSPNPTNPLSPNPGSPNPFQTPPPAVVRGGRQ